LKAIQYLSDGLSGQTPMYVKKFNGDEAIASPNESDMYTPMDLTSAKNTI
jgi:hypothetical protein